MQSGAPVDRKTEVQTKSRPGMFAIILYISNLLSCVSGWGGTGTRIGVSIEHIITIQRTVLQ